MRQCRLFGAKRTSDEADKTPRSIVDKLHDVTQEALNDPALREKLAKLGVEPKQMSIDQFGEFFREDFAEMLQLAKEAHIEPTD